MKSRKLTGIWLICIGFSVIGFVVGNLSAAWSMLAASFVVHAIELAIE